MAVITGAKNGLGVKIRGKVTAPSAYGVRKYGAFYYGAGAKTHGIYQVRTRFGEHVQVKEKHYWPTNPQTGPQQANRQKMTDAVAAWQALTGEQQAVYNKNAIGKEMSGYNLFLSEHLLSN